MKAWLCVAAACAAAACTDELCPSGDCEPRVFVARDIAFAVEGPDGVSDGFDLDGVVSAEGDPAGCGQPDFVAPDGRPGIDNRFAVLWSAVVELIGDAAEGLVRGAINSGTLLLIIELRGVDDPREDDCVDVNLILGAGLPDVGTDGYITSGQTFDIDTAAPFTTVPCARVRDGVLEVGPFDGALRMSVLEVNADLRMHGARIRGPLAPDGSFDGLMGAGLEIDQIVEVANSTDNIPDEVQGLVETLVGNLADLARDEFGDCRHISAALHYQGVSAFLYEDTPR
jgi:hypothetical protein